MSLPAPKHDVEPDNLTTMELGECLPMTAEVIDGHLHIGGVDMVNVAEEFGTALYVYDQADLENRMETYRDAFASRYPNSDVIYASKAFLNKAVCRLVNAHGLCLDVSGGGELRWRKPSISRWSACSCMATTRPRKNCAKLLQQA